MIKTIISKHIAEHVKLNQLTRQYRPIYFPLIFSQLRTTPVVVQMHALIVVIQ